MYVRQDGRKDLNRNEIRNPRATRKGQGKSAKMALCNYSITIGKSGAP